MTLEQAYERAVEISEQYRKVADFILSLQNLKPREKLMYLKENDDGIYACIYEGEDSDGTTVCRVKAVKRDVCIPEDYTPGPFSNDIYVAPEAKNGRWTQ